MTKFVKKIKCTYQNGYICKKDNVLHVDPYIVRRLNALETAMQKMMYMHAQPKAVPMPSLDGFERKTEHTATIPVIHVDTPLMDSKIEESLKLVAEMKDSSIADEVNSKIGDWSDVIAWCDSEKVLVDDSFDIVEFDLPTLGNPLELAGKDIAIAIQKMLYPEAIVDDEE